MRTPSFDYLLAYGLYAVKLRGLGGTVRPVALVIKGHRGGRNTSGQYKARATFFRKLLVSPSLTPEPQLLIWAGG